MSDLSLAAVFEHLPNAIMVLDRHLVFVAANAAYFRATGARPEDVIGHHVFAAFPNDPQDPNSANLVIMRSAFERVLATGKPDELAAVKYRVARTPGGPLDERVWSTKHTPMLDPTGAVEFIIQEAVEITHDRDGSASMTRLDSMVIERAARVQVTATTLDAQLRDMQQMFAQAPGFMCFLRGTEHVFEIVNGPYQQLIGHRDVVGMKVRDATPEVVEQGFLALLDQVFSTGEAFIGNGILIALQRRPGAPPEKRFLDFVYQPIRDAAGSVTGIFVEGQDVTEKYLAAARQKFLIESLPNQVWTSTPEGKLDFVSQRVVEYFGQSTETILGDGWLGVIHPEDLPECIERWTRSLTTGEPYEAEFRLRRADGAYRWHLGRANAERNASGAIRQWFGTNTDIHEARAAVAELRARSVYEQRLIGIVSHDLRNPLSSIGLAASLLGTLDLDPVAKSTVARLTRSVERASRLISDLLDFARARIGTSIPISPRPTNLREIVEQVVDEMQALAPARSVRVGHIGDEDGSWDADRIAQVIANLVGNAMQHGPPDAPIWIESRIDEQDATFAVHNDGPPILEAELAHLFEPFKRGTAAGSAHGSLGLGLYIAREVVVAHGGTIEVQSTVGTGTRFIVRLPRFTA